MGSSLLKSYIAKRTLLDSVNFAMLGLVTLVAVLRPEDEVLLALETNFIIFCGLLILGAILSLGLSSRGFTTLGQLLFRPPDQKRQLAAPPLLKTFWGWQLVITFTVALIVGGLQTQFSLFELADAKGFHSALKLFAGLAAPEWKLLPVAVLKVIETIFIAFMATVLAVPVAFLLAFVSAKNIMTSPIAFAIYSLLRTALNVVRSVEPVIWAIIFSVWVGIGPFAGMLALMIQSVASLTKQYSEILEGVDQGPIDGIQSTGANKVQTIWFAMVPQVILPYISFTIYRWDINVRMATIIGFAGGGGIGTILNQYSMRAQWPEVGCLIFVIAAVVWLMDLTSAYVREALK